jgi:ATP-dependent Clp protease adaptor protein ClpS
VVDMLVATCGHTAIQAEQCSLIVHYKGKCSVKSGSYDDLEPRCTALLEAGLTAEIE